MAAPAPPERRSACAPPRSTGRTVARRPQSRGRPRRSSRTCRWGRCRRSPVAPHHLYVGDVRRWRRVGEHRWRVGSGSTFLCAHSQEPIEPSVKTTYHSLPAARLSPHRGGLHHPPPRRHLHIYMCLGLCCVRFEIGSRRRADEIATSRPQKTHSPLWSHSSSSSSQPLLPCCRCRRCRRCRRCCYRCRCCCFCCCCDSAGRFPSLNSRRVKRGTTGKYIFLPFRGTQRHSGAHDIKTAAPSDL